jgi:hypothetical protein
MDTHHSRPGDLSDDELEERLCALAGSLAATEAEFLLLVAELDDRELWGRPGLRSAAHWLSWRLGMRLGAARERVRVGHALRELPAIAGAFGDGQLSYCKVRALTRVATPTTESELLEIGLGTTGAQCERVVRAWRNVLTAETSASSQLSRSMRRREEANGSVVYTLRVSSDDAPVVDAALGMARTVVLDETGRPVETPEETALAAEITCDPPAVRADADAYLLLAESYVAAGGPTGERGDGLEVVLHADLTTLLAATDANAPAQPAPEQPEPTARVPEQPKSKQPESKRPESKRPEQAEQTEQTEDSVPGALVLERADQTPGRAGIRSHSGQALLTATALRRMCESSVRVFLSDPDGRPLDLGRKVRHATKKQRRVLHVRHDGHCGFPGCTQRHRLIPHHVHWWTNGGLTDMDNLILLCPAHHRAVHEVGYTVRALGDGEFAFTRPDSTPVPETPQLEPLSTRENPFTGAPMVGPSRWTMPEPTWGGEHLDLRHLVDGMAANYIIATGRHIPDVPADDLSRTLREATGWPMNAARRGQAGTALDVASTAA